MNESPPTQRLAPRTALLLATLAAALMAWGVLLTAARGAAVTPEPPEALEGPNEEPAGARESPSAKPAGPHEGPNAGPREGDAAAGRSGPDEPGAPPLPECAYADLPTRHASYGDWARTLVDTTYLLPAEYAPPDLTSLREAGFADDRTVRALVIPDLRALREAARAEGHELEVQSAYRSYAYQEQTFAYWVEVGGRDAALRTSARPGHSEHQLGTALDFRTAGGPAPWDLPDWAATPEGAWMRDNAWRFGFVMSYPAGLEHETCYDYEPWHYRYVGRDAAREVREQGVSLRRWLWQRQEMEE